VDKRKYFRAKVLIPARWQALSAEEKKLVENGQGRALLKRSDLTSPIDEFLTRTTPGSKEEQFYRCLQLVDNKLDFIIDQMFLRSTVDPPRLDNVIEMSGSGLKFTTLEALPSGTLLKMNLIMRGTFQYQMDLIVEVLRVDDKGNGFLTATRFVEIDEETRDSIVKVVFQKQRQEIRREKTNQEDDGAF